MEQRGKIRERTLQDIEGPKTKKPNKMIRKTNFISKIQRREDCLLENFIRKKFFIVSRTYENSILNIILVRDSILTESKVFCKNLYSFAFFADFTKFSLFADFAIFVLFSPVSDFVRFAQLCLCDFLQPY